MYMYMFMYNTCIYVHVHVGVMYIAFGRVSCVQVVDLLIAMANTATHSNRANLILDPYPSLVDPDNINTLALDPQVSHLTLT